MQSSSLQLGVHACKLPSKHNTAPQGRNARFQTFASPRNTCSQRYDQLIPASRLTPRQHRRKPQHATAALPNIAFPDISPDVLTGPFQFANVAISVLWAPIIIAPRWKVTQQVMRSKWTVILPSLGFLYFFLAATVIDSPDLGDVFQKSKYLFTDASAEPRNMAKLLSSPAYAAQDWVHLLIWDFAAGRLIYLDALKKQVPMRPALLVTFIAGPIGYLVHQATCAVVKPKPQQES